MEREEVEEVAHKQEEKQVEREEEVVWVEHEDASGKQEKELDCKQEE